MKLNDNGDFCLLYVEPADEKQSLFATIGEQQKPVVLMLPLAGQPRSRLFQRPEDFSDLKHVRRQSGVSIVFLTAGSELLAQMAARYGFPSYASIDDFADFLAHGRHSLRDEEAKAPPLRRARTGPLMPSAAVAQLAALRQGISTRPLNASLAGTHNVDFERGTRSASPSPMPLASESGADFERGALPVRPLPTPVASDPWTGHESSVVPVEYTAAFHEAQTSPIGGAARFTWPMAGEDVSSVLPTTPHSLASVRNTPAAPARGYGYRSDASLERGLPASLEESAAQARFSEVPRRRSAQLPAEPHTRHPGWQAEERMFEPGEQFTPARLPASAAPGQGLRGSGTRPTRDLREQALTSAPLRVHAHPENAPAGALHAHPLVAASTQQTTTGTQPARLPPALPPVARQGGKRASFWPLLVILSLLILTGGALGSFVAIAHVMPPTPTGAQSVGSITFQSSEQLNENTSQGIDDQVQISLHGLTTPSASKSYYAWLLGDTSQAESQSILLGKLHVLNNGSASLFYAGDAQHTNLLQITSRFLVTEEDSGVVPLLPSPDVSTWRYYGALPALPDPNDTHHYSFLNHLRHLLADEPILDELELPGGLNNWFSRNTEELIQLTSSARDHWQNTHNLTTVRNQGVQILSYLDGMSFMEQDLPAASANVQTTLDAHQAALGLLNVRGTTQNPPSYMDQIAYHLNGLLSAPDAPGNVRTVATRILPALSDITTWLQKLRGDDKNLLAMNDTQLGQATALSLLDDMVLQASNAYSGNTDPVSGQLKQGVVWIRQQLQSIATININTYVAGQTPVPEVAPSSKPGPAFVGSLLKIWQELEQLV